MASKWRAFALLCAGSGFKRIKQLRTFKISDSVTGAGWRSLLVLMAPQASGMTVFSVLLKFTENNLHYRILSFVSFVTGVVTLLEIKKGSFCYCVSLHFFVFSTVFERNTESLSLN